MRKPTLLKTPQLHLRQPKPKSQEAARFIRHSAFSIVTDTRFLYSGWNPIAEFEMNLEACEKIKGKYKEIKDKIKIFEDQIDRMRQRLRDPALDARAREIARNSIKLAEARLRELGEMLKNIGKGVCGIPLMFLPPDFGQWVPSDPFEDSWRPRGGPEA
jgi:hypothetical protein